MLATIAIYLPSLRNGWVFDDWDIFVNNKLIHSWSFIWKSLLRDKFWFRDPAAAASERVLSAGREHIHRC